jgi:hypothetical protein
MKADSVLSDANNDTKDLVRFIVAIWEQDEPSIPDLDWENAGKEEFRVSAAAFITLGVRDGRINYDQDKLNQYFREKIKSDSPHIAMMAILHLGVGGSDEDAALFKKLSQSEQGPLARMAIRSLGMLCSSAGEAALEQLVSELPNEDNRELASETLEKYYGNGPVLRCY